MTTMPVPRLPNPLTPETLEVLMRARPYQDANHPHFKIYRHIVQRGFELMYPVGHHDEFGRGADTPLPPERIAHLVAKENREMDIIYGESPAKGAGAVHVQSHARDGGKTEVADYWRVRPGQGAADIDDDFPKPRNLLDEADAGDENDDGGIQAGTDDGRPTSRSPVPNPRIRNDGEGSGEFGAKRLGGRKHQGIDIEAKPGDEVVSPVDGTIKRIAPAYEDPKYEGLEAITITGDDKREYKFLYVPPKDGDGNPIVQEKDRVSAGDPIGTVQDRAAHDRTGKMDNHIHIEVRDKSGKVVDPTPQVEEWQNRQ